MAIKIIKRGIGIDVDGQVYRETCSFCQAEVEFEGRDAKNFKTGSSNAKIIDCPVCGCWISANLMQSKEEVEVSQ
jgi:hypothetical protein